MAENEKKHVQRNVGPMHAQVAEKPKDFKKALKNLTGYLKPFLPVICIAIVLAVTAAVLSIIGPNQIADLTNAIQVGVSTATAIDMNVINRIGITLIILYLSSAIFSYCQQFIMATTANRFAKKLRMGISHKINTIPLAYMDNHTRGDVLSRVTNDVDTVAYSLSQSLGSLFNATALLLGSTVMMFVTNWQMALTAICASLLGLMLTFLLMKYSQKYFARRQVELGAINGHIEEIYTAHNVVKAYNAQTATKREFDTLNHKLYKSNRMSEFLAGMMPPIMDFVGNLGFLAVVVVGAILFLNNQISFGLISAFVIYVRLFTQPLSQIAQCLNRLQSGMAASERVFEFLGEADMPDESHCTGYIDPHNAQGNIVFDHVRFSYQPEKPIIKDFCCTVKPGQKIAIVGPTGAGKTTLVNLLMKFYDIDAGDIVIDGQSIKNLTRENLHNLFTMVLQDTWLFNGTVRENLCYNHTNIDDAKIMSVCQIVGIEQFIKTLPHGLDTVLDDSNTISAGQKQLLTIVRGMLQDAPFLILDEATSSVDTRTEELVQKAMDQLTKNRTSFIIAHRLSTIKNADKILVLDHGDVVEQGNHQQLMQKNGAYANLYNAQFKK